MNVKRNNSHQQPLCTCHNQVVASDFPPTSRTKRHTFAAWSTAAFIAVAAFVRCVILANVHICFSRVRWLRMLLVAIFAATGTSRVARYIFYQQRHVYPQLWVFGWWALIFKWLVVYACWLSTDSLVVVLSLTLVSSLLLSVLLPFFIISLKLHCLMLLLYADYIVSSKILQLCPLPASRTMLRWAARPVFWRFSTAYTCVMGSIAIIIIVHREPYWVIGCGWWARARSHKQTTLQATRYTFDTFHVPIPADNDWATAVCLLCVCELCPFVSCARVRVFHVNKCAWLNIANVRREVKK